VAEYVTSKNIEPMEFFLESAITCRNQDQIIWNDFAKSVYVAHLWGAPEKKNLYKIFVAKVYEWNLLNVV